MKYILNRDMLARCLGATTPECFYPTNDPLPESLRRTLEEQLEDNFSDRCDFLNDDCHYIIVYESVKECKELHYEDCFETAQMVDDWWVALLLLNNESSRTYVMRDKYISAKLRRSLKDAQL